MTSPAPTITFADMLATVERSSQLCACPACDQFRAMARALVPFKTAEQLVDATFSIDALARLCIFVLSFHAVTFVRTDGLPVVNLATIDALLHALVLRVDYHERHSIRRQPMAKGGSA